MIFFKKVAAIVGKDLRLELRTLESLSAMFLFSLIVIVVFAFAFDFSTLQTVGKERLIPGVIWITLIFSAIIGFNNSFAIERDKDCILALILCPVDPGAIYLGKALANLIIVSILEVILLPLTAIFFDFNLLSIIPVLTPIVVLNTIGFSEIGTLFAALASKVKRGEALLSILLFPVSSPLIISAVKCTSAAMEGKGILDFSNWLYVSLGFDIIFFFAAFVLFEYIIED
ncbi:MAG: heme exporter protein CcmB [Acidobacteriota bacterium]